MAVWRLASRALRSRNEEESAHPCLSQEGANPHHVQVPFAPLACRTRMLPPPPPQTLVSVVRRQGQIGRRRRRCRDAGQRCHPLPYQVVDSDSSSFTSRSSLATLCSSSYLGRARTASLVAADQARASARLPVLAGATWPCAWLFYRAQVRRLDVAHFQLQGELGRGGNQACTLWPRSPSIA